jgi:hypothetical protein
MATEQLNRPSEHLAKKRSIAIVTALVGKDMADRWWNSPNKAFNMRTPAGMWIEDYHMVYDYLLRMADSGW